MIDDYVNGFLERKEGGSYNGRLSIDGVDISPIEGVYFKQEGNTYLWIKRKPIMEYDFESQTYKTRKPEPQWEAYLKKQVDGNTVAYKGEFAFLRFMYSIEGVWDSVLGKDKKRLNFYIERLPMSRQTILNNINERRQNDKK